MFTVYLGIPGTYCNETEVVSTSRPYAVLVVFNDFTPKYLLVSA